jgi:2-methylisocitrate lyase-like PEP mutase family enzyme
MERAVMVREIAVIANAVRVPVTADIEAGYGPRPADVAETVEGALAAGAVGVNLEDNTHGAREEPLYGIDEQAARIAAARAAADRRGLALVINARTDTFFAEVGADIEERTVATIERGRAYLRAGADLVFVPLLLDPVIVRRVADEIDGPINLMILPDAPSAETLFATGAKRLSIGPAAMLAALGVLAEIADEMRQIRNLEIDRTPFLWLRRGRKSLCFDLGKVQEEKCRAASDRLGRMSHVSGIQRPALDLDQGNRSGTGVFWSLAAALSRPFDVVRKPWSGQSKNSRSTIAICASSSRSSRRRWMPMGEAVCPISISWT